LENKELDRKKNILAAAGLLKPGVPVADAFKKIDIRLVDFDTGEYVEDRDPATYDQRRAAADPDQSIRLTSAQDVASIKRRANQGVVYLAKNDSGEVTRIILPVKGYGLWSTLYGFLALESDAVTVAGLGFYEHAETPGLGGEVDNPNWKAQWRGKKFLTDQGDPAIRMYKGSVTASTPEGEYKFDALSGATLTSRGVENLMRFWAGDLGYGPYLKRVQEKGV
ncbi:MAG: Na(+)-translocating NADH-quinone reductase subunit C, partial [Gammaproteobacteria bacterium]